MVTWQARRRCLAALTLLALTGCGDPPPPPDSGTITGMVAEPGHYETVESDVCVAYDTKTFACSISVPYSDEVWHDPTWTICLRADDNPDHTGCISVTQDQYAEYVVGGHYPDHR